MRPKIIKKNGIDYGVNLIGDLYEIMIPGTKCPISSGVLNHLYEQGQSPEKIAEKIKSEFYVSVAQSSVREWLTRSGVRFRTYSENMRIRTKNGNAPGQSDKARQSVRDRNSRMPATRPSDSHIKKIIKAAADAKIARRVGFNCVFCGKHNRIPLCHAQRSENHFCNKTCAAKFNQSERRKKARIPEMFCTKCYSQSMHFKGNNGRYRRFYCDVCKITTTQPVLGLGLKKSLESDCVLHNGKILHQLIVTKKEG